ncbi:MAG: acetylxylan esterase [Bacteroidales bacterium]|nr:acetylxylan esterase [Bacteroidales bacterium]MDD4031058.1 acetylxylan esterase [Bacteroidales bacterium]MDD4434616.1 acetylxylan esterase [Bacteroidales bacterium]MDD5732521.1 acetylxylan esterase [Bacteroidales bacterium]
MKKTFLSFLTLILVLGCNQPPAVREVALDPAWKFQTGNDLQWALPAFDDSQWPEISPASSWESQGYTNYDGYGWYRKTFTIPEDILKAVTHYGGLLIRYDNADDSDALYFNGQIIGATGSFPPNYASRYGEKRSYTVPLEYIRTDEPNTIAIQVYDGGGNGGLMTSALIIQPVAPALNISMKYNVDAENGVFMGEAPRTLSVTVNNREEKNKKTVIHLAVTTDDHQPVQELSRKITIKKQDSITCVLPLEIFAPGFYRCTLRLETDGIRGEPTSFNIGLEPEKIISPVDAQEDFDDFWTETRSILDNTPMRPAMKLLKEYSTGARNIYYVEMRSFGNEIMGGYYAVPKEKGKYPVIITYMGYGSNPWMPHTDGEPGFISFVVSVRGQGIYKAGNKYDDNWIVWGIEDKNDYYYRGAFMDLVRAIDFICSRAEADKDRIAAEGGSQGGAFTMAACALDDRIAVAAPTIPFLSDYPDYFRIVDWPRSDIDAYMKAHPQATWEEIYKLLSYFDIKNLAPRIKTPTIMGVGLQDPTCPPHTNFAGYNLITAPKDYRIYQNNGHNTPPEWQEVRMEFFKKYLNLD